MAEEPGGADGDQRPVAPDVDPVGQRHERVVIDDQALQIALAGDPERLLEMDERARVGLGRPGVVARRGAHAEVHEQPGEDERELAHPLVPRGLAASRASRACDRGCRVCERTLRTLIRALR